MSYTTFGGGLSAAGTTYDLRVSDDQKTFTMTFDALQVEIGNGDADVVTMTGALMWLVAPLDGVEPGVPITFGISGFALTEGGGTASLGLRLAGRSSSVELPTDTEKDFVETLTYLTTGYEKEVHLAVSLIAERDGVTGGVSHLDVLAIDGALPLDATG